MSTSQNDGTKSTPRESCGLYCKYKEFHTTILKARAQKSTKNRSPQPSVAMFLSSSAFGVTSSRLHDLTTEIQLKRSKKRRHTQSETCQISTYYFIFFFFRISLYACALRFAILVFYWIRTTQPVVLGSLASRVS
jgi:hypothetical protein